MINSSIALNAPRRVVLEGVPRVHFYDGGPRCPEDLTIPSVLQALMEYFGEEDFGCRTSRTLQPGCKINCAYSFFVGVTGEAAYLSWKEGWHGDNVAAFYMSDDPAAPERMRCDRASTIAVINHPKYGQDKDLLTDAARIADGDIRRHFEYAIIIDLPVALAKSVMEPHIPQLLKTQRANGLWKIEDAERKSFWLLAALKHSTLLEGLGKEGAFQHDPYMPFQESSDLYGYVIRRDFSHTLVDTDIRLKSNLVSAILDAQETDGSWGHTIVVTCKRLEELHLLSEPNQSERIQKAAEWLFSAYNLDMVGFHVGVPYGIPAHGMFSTPNRWVEFESALKERPEWDPKQLCYNHLAIIQNGIATQTLIRLGYQDDERVIKACDNLFTLKEKFGGWCQSNITQGLAYKRWAGIEKT